MATKGGGASGVPAGGRDGVRGGMGLVYFMRLRLGQLHNLNYFVPSRVPVAALELARTQALALNEPAHHGQLQFFGEHQRHFCGEQRMGLHGG